MGCDNSSDRLCIRWRNIELNAASQECRGKITLPAACDDHDWDCITANTAMLDYCALVGIVCPYSDARFLKRGQFRDLESPLVEDIEQVIGQILIAPIQILNEENPGFGPRQQRRPERS